jgi:hypothetical protein
MLLKVMFSISLLGHLRLRQDAILLRILDQARAFQWFFSQTGGVIVSMLWAEEDAIHRERDPRSTQ